MIESAAKYSAMLKGSKRDVDRKQVDFNLYKIYLNYPQPPGYA